MQGADRELVEIGEFYSGTWRAILHEEKANSTKIDEADLWHRRMGHASVDAILQLEGQARGVPPISKTLKEKCEICILGKNSRKPFNKVPQEKATRPLQLVHSDVCGPIHPTSTGGANFFSTFTDEKTKYLKLYTQSKKSETINKLKEYYKITKKNSKEKMECWRSDGGGEFNSNEVKEYCKRKGIRQQITPPDTPQWNGTAERMNRTIIEKVRCMLLDSGLDHQLWAEAAATAAYLYNRTPCKGLGGKTPYEAWTGFKPALGHLRTFGCQAHVQVLEKDRKKLDPKTIKLTFVGYDLENGSYRFWNPKTRKIVRSRDAEFIERREEKKEEVETI